MSDTKWLLRQGFETCDEINSGFSLLVKKIEPNAINPTFKEVVKTGICPDNKGIVVYYSNRCPFADYHVKNSLVATATKRNLPLKIIKLKTMEQAQAAPSPATIFSLFLDGQFITTDLSSCLDSQFDKIIEKSKN